MAVRSDSDRFSDMISFCASIVSTYLVLPFSLIFGANLHFFFKPSKILYVKKALENKNDSDEEIYFTFVCLCGSINYSCAT